MMCDHQQNGPPDTQSGFASALSYWQATHDRYHTLRRLSDAEAQLAPPYPGETLRESALESEIDDLGCALEDAALQIALSPDTSPSDIDAILCVLLDDLIIRHQLENSDTAIHLILSARRVLTGNVSAKGYS